MALSASLYTGVSGLGRLGDAMQTIGDNISNVSTIGFKKNSFAFSTVLSQTVGTQTGIAQVGRGVGLASIRSNYSIGAFESTSVSTDMAIAGEGFFTVKNDSADALYYTRAGNFHLDNQQKFVNDSGQILQGYKIEDSKGSLSALRNVIIEEFISEPTESTNITVISNLPDTEKNSNGKVTGEKKMLSNSYLVPASSNDSTIASSLYKHKNVVAIYDSLGNQHEINIFYDRQPKWGQNETDKWEYVITCDPVVDQRTTISGAERYKGLLARGILEFDGGKLSGMSMDTFTGRIGNVETEGSIRNEELSFSIENSNVMQIDGYGFQFEYTESGGWNFQKDNVGAAIKPEYYQNATIIQGSSNAAGFSINLDGDPNSVGDLSIALAQNARINDKISFDINDTSNLSNQSFNIRNTSSQDLGGENNFPLINAPNSLTTDASGIIERDFATDTWYFLNAKQTEAKRTYNTNSSDSNYGNLLKNGVLRNGKITRTYSNDWSKNILEEDRATIDSTGTVITTGYPKVNNLHNFTHKSEGISMEYVNDVWEFNQIANLKPKNANTSYKNFLVVGDSITNEKIEMDDENRLTETVPNMKTEWNASDKRWELVDTGEGYSNALINRGKSSTNKVVIDLDGSTNIATIENPDNIDQTKLVSTIKDMTFNWDNTETGAAKWKLDGSSVSDSNYPNASASSNADNKLVIDLDGPNFTDKNEGTATNTDATSALTANATGYITYDHTANQWEIKNGDFEGHYTNFQIQNHKSNKTKLVVDIDGGDNLLNNTSIIEFTNEEAPNTVRDIPITWNGTSWELGDEIKSVYQDAEVYNTSNASTLVINLNVRGVATPKNLEFVFTSPMTIASKEMTFSIQDADTGKKARITSSTIEFDFLTEGKVDDINALNSGSGLKFNIADDGSGNKDITILNSHNNEDIVIIPHDNTFDLNNADPLQVLPAYELKLDINPDSQANKVQITNTNDEDITFELDSNVAREQSDSVMFNVFKKEANQSAKVEIVTEPTFKLNGNLETLIQDKGFLQTLNIGTKWDGTQWIESNPPHNTGNTLSAMYTGATIVEELSNANKIVFNFSGAKISSSVAGANNLQPELTIDLPQVMTRGEEIAFDAIPNGIQGYSSAEILTEDSGKTIKIYLNGIDQTQEPDIIYQLDAGANIAMQDRFSFDIDPSDDGKATPDYYEKATLTSNVSESKEYLKIDLDGTGRNDDIMFEFDVNPQGGSGLGYIKASSNKANIENSNLIFDILGSTSWKTKETNDDGFFEFDADFLGGVDGSTFKQIELNVGGRYNTSNIWEKEDRTSTQYGSNSATTFQSTDGYGVGEYEGVTIQADGTVIGVYSNGQNTPIFKIPIARFLNPHGLNKEGNNLYSVTVESGDALLNEAGTNGAGSIVSNSIENSNVDIAEEFISMITTQRGFQANSKIITSADEMLTEVLNMKR